MNTLGLVVFLTLVLFQAPSCGTGGRTEPSTPTPTPQPCCGDRNSATARVAFSATVAPTSSEVPAALFGCGFNREEITAITMSGTVAGCVGPGSSEVTFPRLVLTFTTDSARCGGTQGILNRTVTLTNVRYTNQLRWNSGPTCIRESTISYDTAGSADPQFNTLFVTHGRETLEPIIDRFVFSWAFSNPPVSCPIALTFTGVSGASLRCR
jgi:hypothetical protein